MAQGGLAIRLAERAGVVRSTLIASLLSALPVPGLCFAGADTASKPKVAASAAILVDAETGTVLFEKNADANRPPASTTKILTALLLLEHTAPGDWIVASKHASETEGSSLHLKPGEAITASDALYALMLRSANDVCVAVAEHISGSIPAFTKLMNARAKEIGAARTVFRNPHGLNAPKNTTTARDLAAIARCALRYPEFAEAVRSRYRVIERSMNTQDVWLKNHAKILWKFPGADGVKTGYTVPAGRCFVGSATWNGWRLISVVLNSPDVVGETGALLKYGFKQFHRAPVALAGESIGTARVRGGRAGSVAVAPISTLYVVARRGNAPRATLRADIADLTAPLPTGAAAGTLSAMDGDRELSQGPLVTLAPAARRPEATTGSILGGWRLFAVLVALGAGYAATTSQATRRRRGRFEAALRGDRLFR